MVSAEYLSLEVMTRQLNHLMDVAVDAGRSRDFEDNGRHVGDRSPSSSEHATDDGLEVEAVEVVEISNGASPHKLALSSAVSAARNSSSPRLFTVLKPKHSL